MNNSYSIYKITSPSGKVYIGQSKNVQRRLKDYRCSNTIRYQVIIYNSILKYGFDKHSVEILHKDLTPEEANSLEIQEITKFKELGISMNVSEGGQKASYTRNKPIVKCDLNGSFLKKYDNIVEAAKEMNSPPNALSAVIRNKTYYYKGFLYTSAKDWFRGERPIWKAKVNNKSTLSRRLYQFDLEGNFIRDYASAEEAGRILGVRATAISAVLRKRVYRCKSWLFSYNKTVDKYQDPRSNIILQLDEKENIIKEFSSLRQIKKELGLGSETISKMLKNNYTLRGITLKFKNHGKKSKKSS